MKRILAIVLIASLLFLASCTKATESKESIKAEPTVNISQLVETVVTESPYDNIDDSYFGKYQMSDEGFSEQVKNNAIDREYDIELSKFQGSSNFTTQSWVELEDKYNAIWEKELNNSYKKLLEKLNKKEQKELQKAQNGWLQFNDHESGFVYESWGDLGLGTQGKVELVASEKDRIRERTLQLMEYYYMLGGKVEFLYKGTGK